MADIKQKNRIAAQAGVLLPAETAERALITNATGEIKSSTVTSTELGYVSGVTSSIQTQLTNNSTAITDHINDASDAHDASAISNVPAGNLAATDVQAALNELQSDIDTRALDADVIKKDGSVDFTADQSMGGFKLTDLADPTLDQDAATKKYVDDEIAALPNPIFYAGTYDASLNSPDLDQAGTRIQGALYRVTVAGTHDFGAFGGSITFNVGDKVVYNGTAWEKWDVSDEVLSVNGQTGVVVLDTDDINEGITNLYFTDERAQDAVGTILVDSSSVDFTYDDGTPSITAAVIPGGVDHDQLLNFVTNEHVDHSTVQIATAAATSGLVGGGDITTTRNLSVDILGTTAETSPDDADSILIYDSSAAALKSMTRANFLQGVGGASAGDIVETSFSAANNQAVAADVTGLLFAPATVRGFKALVTVSIDATSDLFETFELIGVNKGSSFDMAVSSVGDDSGLVFSITAAGQVQYTSTDIAGFVSNTVKFRATTTTV